MNPTSKKAKELFVQLVRNVPQDEWESQIQKACAGDKILQNRVQALLRAHLDPDSFLQHPIVKVEDQANVSTISPMNNLELDTSLPSSQTRSSRPSQYSTGETFGDYIIENEIARGGMGVVFKVKQVSLNRTVALKMILSSRLAGPDAVRRFQSEAESAAKLDHSGIVPIYEVGEIGGQHFFSMGLVQGGSLATLTKKESLSERDSAQLIQRIAHAIQYAHSRNIIHRDLKPDNVLLDVDGLPKVTDFGLAKDIEVDSGLTATGAIMGTPGYMAPEQASGKLDEVGPLADVYALGGILYFLLTGKPPFTGKTVIETIHKVIHEEVKFPPQSETDLDLKTICLKCLEKDPALRYASAGELAKELELFLEGKPISARPVPGTEKLWRWCKRNTLIAGLSGSLLILTVTALAVTIALALIANGQAVALASANKELTFTIAELEEANALLRADMKRRLVGKWDVDTEFDFDRLLDDPKFEETKEGIGIPFSIEDVIKDMMDGVSEEMEFQPDGTAILTRTFTKELGGWQALFALAGAPEGSKTGTWELIERDGKRAVLKTSYEDIYGIIAVYEFSIRVLDSHTLEMDLLENKFLKNEPIKKQLFHRKE